MSAPPRVLRFQGCIAPLVVAAVFGAVGEASAAARATGRPWSAIALTAALSAALLSFPVLALSAAVVGVALRQRSVRVLGRVTARVLTGGRARYAGLLIVLGLLAVAASSAAAEWLGVWLAANVSPRFAVGGTLAVDDALMVVSLLLVAVASPAASRLLSRVADGRPAVRAVTDAQGTICVLALVLAAVALIRLPLAYAAAPSSICFGLVIGLSSMKGTVRPRRWGGASCALAAVGSWALGSLVLAHAPAEAQLAVVTRTPFVSLVVGAVRKTVDFDHDGYSSLLLGGDCDDRDPQKNPAARDIPGNGIDENCSGADARPYAPVQPAASPRPSDLPPRANVVMIQLDAVRPDHVGFTGYPRQTTRNLDTFSESATWFARAYSPMPSTRFAIAAVFTGKDGSAVSQEYAGGPDYTLLPEAETIAERLGTVGYARRGLSISYVLQHIHGVEQGFDEFKTPWPVDDWARTYPTSATLTTDAALAELTARPPGGSPYFLFVHYQCAHDPYAAQHEWPFGAEPVDQYDSAIAYCDHELGRLLRALDARSDRDATALVVFSDHGELFGEHGLTAHGNSIYEPDARALLLLRMPGARKPATVNDVVSLTDLAPTVLELAGLTPRADTDAWSLVRYVTPGAPPPPVRPIYLGADLWRGPVHYLAVGVVEGRYKLVHDVLGRTDELFDVREDPMERMNLAPILPDLRARLVEDVEAHGGRGKVF